MSAKVLLISINRCRNPYPVFPLGVSHIAGKLKEKGFATEILDMSFQSPELESVISRFSPDFIGLSLRNIDDVRIDKTQFFVPDLSETVRRIKLVSKSVLILGGSAFSLFPEKLLQMSGADYGVVSEGEASLIELLNMLSGTQKDAGLKLQKIPGLVYRSGQSFRKNLPAVLPVSEITTPYRSLEITRHYLQSSGVMNVQTQRGCPFTCCYCTYPLIEGDRARFRSAQAVAEDVKDALRSGAKYIFIVDSAFNTDNAHVAGICEEFLKIDEKFEWGCFLRPNGLTPELMNLMARAGLRHIEFGSDSLCDSVLESYSKGFTFEEILYSSELARKEDVHYSHFLITGGPGETEETLRQSFKNSLSFRKTVIFPFTGMRIYPGTPFYERVLQEKYISPEADLLEPAFYVSPLISRERIAELLCEFHQKSPNWVVDDLSPEQIKVMEWLRKKGINGPLWEFLAR
ncbi:MAG: radical SAM protein [Fibrobacter sp.]|nr:radical SAM protein [Fibrobacter sp.]